MIAAPNLHAADVQFAGDADGERLEVATENVSLGVGNRPADRHAPPVAIGLAGPSGHIHGGFGRTVEVMQLRAQPGSKAFL